MPAPPPAPPTPAALVVVPEGPPLSPQEVIAKTIGVRLRNENPKLEGLMDRSSGIWADPKMREISGLLKSHQGAEEPAESSGSGSGSSSGGTQVLRRRASLRAGARDLVDRRMKELEHTPTAKVVDSRPGLELLQQGLAPPSPTPASPPSPLLSPSAADWGTRRSGPTAADEDLKRPLGQKPRLELDAAMPRSNFRDTTDKTLKRLLIDMDLARDPDRQRDYSHQTRCDHLDKMHGWYLQHTMKDDKKDRKAPPYLLFSKEGPVSPGSMRVQFKKPSPLLASRGQSGSSPALLTGTGT